MSPDDPRHGTNAGYIAGCREECCRTAHADYRRNLGAKRYLARVERLYIDATGTKRRIHALIALGHTYRDINTRAGWAADHHGGHAHNITRHKRVHIDTAAKVAAVYESLSMQLGTGPMARRQRHMAERKGWAPPLAWDDESIDDPTAKPHLPRKKGAHKPHAEVDEAVVLRVLSGETLPCTKAEKDEVMRRWVASGKAGRVMAERMGWHDHRYGKGAA